MHEIIDLRYLKQEGDFMKKRILLLVCLCMLISAPIVFAEDEVSVETEVTSTAIIQNDYSPQLVQKIKMQRSTIYNALNLTPCQTQEIKKIDECRYKELEPELKKLCIVRKNLKTLNCAKTCDKKAIKSCEKELNQVKKNIKEISNKYDKQFKNILTSDQKSKYSMVRKLKRSDLKKVEKMHRDGQKPSDLKPFGDTIPQSVYLKEIKQQNSFWNKLKKCKTN